MTNRIFPISRFTVNGNSMLPTLSPGQNVISFNWAYFGQKPRAGDIVIIKQDGKEMVKRVQKVTQSVIPASSSVIPAWAPTESREGIQIKVFVAGDNSLESIDSRHFGMIKLSQIIGKVIYVSSHPNIPHIHQICHI